MSAMVEVHDDVKDELEASGRSVEDVQETLEAVVAAFLEEDADPDETLHHLRRKRAARMDPEDFVEV